MTTARRQQDPIKNGLLAALQEDLKKAVTDTLLEILPDLLNKAKPVPQVETSAALVPGTRLRMKQMQERYNVTRHTILRWERQGKIPPRRLFPNGDKAWLSDDVIADFSAATPAKPGRFGSAKVAARLHH